MEVVKRAFLRETFRPSDSPIRVLILDDSEADSELVRQELRRKGIEIFTERVDSEDAFASALSEFVPDVVLSDHSLARFDALSALKLLRRVRSTIPLIIVTCSLHEDKAAAYLRAGAEDLILKDDLGRLAASITRAIQARHSLKNLTQRQLEVLQMVAAGLRTRAIAARLELSVKTVESHRSELMTRLDIHSMAGLARYAMRVGLVITGAES